MILLKSTMKKVLRLMIHSKTSGYLDLRLNLFHELINSSKELLLNISNHHFDHFADHLSAREQLFNKIILLDKQNSNDERSIDASMIQVFKELDDKMEQTESDLITTLSLKIHQLGTDYENKVKGLVTLKGYKNTYFNENKETIGIV